MDGNDRPEGSAGRASAGPLAPRRRVVLASVDLTEPSRAALEWAVDYVRATRAALHVLLVADRPRDDAAPQVWNEILRRSELEDWLHHHCVAPRLDVGHPLDLPLPDDVSPVPATCAIVPGQPAREILRVAVELEASLLVLGARHLGWLDRLTESSVSRQVLKTAPCPVVICRARE